jgi:uncharacterized Zn finger protein
MTDNSTEAIQQPTYCCPDCGAESFGLVVEEGDVTVIRCQTCTKVIRDE